MTAISALNTDINLDNLFKNIEITNVCPFIEHGAHGCKGTSNKTKRKSRKPEKKKTFFNQVTIHVECDKRVNVKLFNNGKIQMTGLKYEDHGSKVLQILIPIIKDLDNKNETKICNNSDIIFSPMNIVLINSDFDIGYKVRREILHREIVDAGMYSSYEPCIYPGVNSKFFWNKTYKQNSQYNYPGKCHCNSICNGKGTGHGDSE